MRGRLTRVAIGLGAALAVAPATADAGRIQGVIYGADDGQPIRGAAVGLVYDRGDSQAGQPVPADRLGPGQAGQLTGAGGGYAFDVEAGREYALVIDTAAIAAVFPSRTIPPTPGFAEAEAGLVVDPARPAHPDARGADRTYYLRFDLRSGDSDFRNNHVPLDRLAGVVDIDVRADRPSAAVGDRVEYTVTLTNRSSRDLTAAAGRPVFVAAAPARGLAYRPGSSVARLRHDGDVTVLRSPADFSDRPDNPASPRLVRFGGFDLPAGAELVLRYRVTVGLDSRPGQYDSRLQLVDGAGVALSAAAEVRVRVVADDTLESTLVLGRVFCDSDSDGRVDPGEAGVYGAVIHADSGTYAVTDSAGSYHLSRVGVGAHLIKLDTDSLAGGRLLGQAARLVRMSPGLADRIDFAVRCNQVTVTGGHQRVERTLAPRPPRSRATARAAALLVGDLERFALRLGARRIPLPRADLTPIQGAGPIRFRTAWAAPPNLVPARWRLVITRRDRRAALRTLVGLGTPPAVISWDGLTETGVRVTDRRAYVAQLIVLADDRSTEVASARVSLADGDRLAPPLQHVVWRGALFAGSPTAPRASAELTRRVAALIGDGRRIESVEIEVHAADSGDRLGDISRTQAQASVLAALVKRNGVAAPRVRAHGRGSAEPAADGGSQTRVELVVRRRGSPAAAARDQARIGTRELPVRGGQFRVPWPGGERAVELVAADGRRAFIRVGEAGTGGAVIATLARPEAVAARVDLTSGSIEIGELSLTTDLLELDGIIDDTVDLSAGIVDARLAAPAVDRWSLELADGTRTAGVGGRGKPPRLVSVPVVAAGDYRYRLEVHRGDMVARSPERLVRVSAPTELLPPIGGRLFTRAGRLTTAAKNKLSFAARTLRQAATEQPIRVTVRAAVPGASATDRGLALAARASRVRGYLTRLGVAPDRLQINTAEAAADQLQFESAARAGRPAPLAPPPAEVVVAGTRLALNGQVATGPVTVPAGDRIAVVIRDGSGRELELEVDTDRAAPLRTTARAVATDEPTTGELADVAAGRLRVQLPPAGSSLAARTLGVRGRTEAGNRIFVGAGKLREVTVDERGEFAALVELPAGDVELVLQSLDRAGNRATVRWPLQVSDRQLFAMALVEGIAGSTWTSRGWSADGLWLDGMTEDSSLALGPLRLHGRAVGYVRARYGTPGTPDGLEVTAHLDTARPAGTGAFFEDLLDPTRDLPVYGDSADEVRDVNSRGKAYLRVAGRGVVAAVGSVHTELESGDLFSYNRTVSGALIGISRGLGPTDVEARAFATADTDGVARDVNWFRTTGGSLYYLRRRFVSEGSERVRVVVRDRDSGLVVDERDLVRNVDYTIDYTGGRVQLIAPLPSSASAGWIIDNYAAAVSPAGGHPVYLEVGYEYVADGAGDHAAGARISDRVGPVTVGVGAVVEDRDAGSDYQLWGAHAAVRLGDRSRVSAEVAGSRQVDADNLLSMDGGLSFQTTAGPELGARDAALGWRLGAVLHLGDFAAGGPLARTRVGALAQQLDRNFSAGGALFERGRLKVGFRVDHELAGGDQLELRHLAEVAELPRVGPTRADVGAASDPLALDERATFATGVAWSRRRGPWDYRAEALHHRLTSEAARADGSPAVDAQRVGLGAAAGYRVSEALTVRARQQLMHGLGDADPILDPIDSATGRRGSDALAGFATGAGVELAVTPSVDLTGDVTQRWNGDNAAEIGLRAPLAGGAMYVVQRAATAGGRPLTATIVGARDRLGTTSGHSYGEYQLENGILGARNRAVLGLGHSLPLSRQLRLRSGYEHQQAFGGVLPDGTPVGNSQRDVVHAGLDYALGRRLRASGRLELRYDSGPGAPVDDLFTVDPRTVAGGGLFPDHGGIAPGAPLVLPPGDRLQLVAGAGVSAALQPELTWLARGRLAHSERLDGGEAAVLARYRELTTGLAFRPRAAGLHLLGRYSFVRDDRPVDFLASARSDERAHVLALLPLAELTGRVTLAGKLALKLSETRGELAGESLAMLSLIRLAYRVWGRWDAAVEARLLALDKGVGGELRAGGLGELGYRVSRLVRLGVGYDLSRFSDDELADLERDRHGFFVRVTAQY